MFILELLGPISLRGDARPVPVAAQQKRPLGLLTIITLHGRRGVSRDRIESYLWPDNSTARAKHALDQLVYAIRQALGNDAILSAGPQLQLNPEVVRADVWDFEDAIRVGQWAAAVGHYKGPLLDGFHFADSSELESWIEAERARLLHDYQSALERLATLAAEAGDYSQAVIWRRRLANSDPLSAGHARKLMLALGEAGDRAGAVKHARLYQQLISQELEMPPDVGIEDLAATFSTAARHVSPDGAPGESGVRDVAQPRPVKHTRLASVLSIAALIVLLIGAVVAQNRHQDAADQTARDTSSTALPTARAAYLYGLAAWRDGSKQGLDSAVRYFRRATELDPEYAVAYAGLADAYVMQGYFGYQPRDAVFPEAKGAALRSLQLDSTLASALPALAYALAWERDFAGANAAFQKAIARDPTYGSAEALAPDPTSVTAHQWYSILLAILEEKPGAVVAEPRAGTRDAFSLSDPVIAVTFTKWIDTYPAMAGFTSFGPGTLTGGVLSRIDDGVSMHLIARYEVTDPHGSHSFKAVVQGNADNKTGQYDLNGIVTWGWMTGAHVHMGFQRITPCEFGKRNVCFRGTIKIRRG